MGVMTIRELNANISRAVGRVEAGETIDLIKRGKIVAELRPKLDRDSAEWRKAHAESIAFLSRGLDLGGSRITQDDKYGDAPL